MSSSKPFPPHIALLKQGINKTGGLEKYTHRMLRAFVEKGCKVTLLTTDSPLIKNASFSTRSFKLLPSPSFAKILQYDTLCSRWIEKNKPDLIFGMDRNRFQTHIRAGNGVHAAYLCQRAKEERISKTLFHKINPLHRTILSLEKRAFTHPKLRKIFTNSHRVKKEILDHYEVCEKKIEVVHNGVEWIEMEKEFLSWEEEKPFVMKKLSLPSSFHFLFIGNDYKRKGLDKLLFALAPLAKEDFFLSVIGKEKNEKKFIDLAHHLGLRKKVGFFGVQKNVRPFYQMADSLVIPSLYDPFANVTVEALAMGLFVVSSKYNGGSEVLSKENGVVIEDLFSSLSIQKGLKIALMHKKKDEAKKIRQSVKHLDFSSQLEMMVKACLD